MTTVGTVIHVNYCPVRLALNAAISVQQFQILTVASRYLPHFPLFTWLVSDFYMIQSFLQTASLLLFAHKSHTYSSASLSYWLVCVSLSGM